MTKSTVNAFKALKMNFSIPTASMVLEGQHANCVIKTAVGCCGWIKGIVGHFGKTVC